MKSIMQVIILLIISVTLVYGKELNVDKGKNNLVKFISDASLEQFEGITNSIDGYMYWEGMDLTEESRLYFEVDLDAIDTGIGLRNRHMRENYLETDKFRFTNFSGKITEVLSTGSNTYDVKAKGTISIHGVVKPLTITATISMNSESKYNVKSMFEVKLSDFDIEVPSIMFLKLSELIKVVVDFSMIETNTAG